MSTASKSSTGSTPLSTAVSIIADLPDDRPRVSELIKCHESLIKGQLEKYLPLHNTETIRKIRNASNRDEGMPLLRRAFEEDPTLLHKLKEANGKEKGIIQSIIFNLMACCITYILLIIAQQTGQVPKVKSPPPVPPKPKKHQSEPAIKPQTAATPQPKQLDVLAEQPQDPSSSEQPQDPLLLEQPQDPSLSEQPQNSSSLEYVVLREMLAVLVDLLAGNAPVVTQLNNHIFSSGLIAKAVHIDAQNSSLSPYDRANKMINAVLATLECHPNPNSVFTSLITALHEVGLVTTATKLSDAFSKYCNCFSVPHFLVIFRK